ncbi:MAG: hypothetical protein J6O50_13245 [Ruminiclostridium sp.]|nr:hypothetical protein [Ruminiclostridium sp.]
MKKHISLLASAAVILGMLPALTAPASAANNIPVSVSSAVKTSYRTNETVIGKNVRINGNDVSESVINDFAKKVNAAALGNMILPVDASSAKNYYTISGYSDSGYFSVSCINGKYFDYFSINDCAYPYNKALDTVCRKISVTDDTKDSIPDRMLKYRVECSEPKTEEEYFNAAATLVGAWLDSLKKETGEYKIGSYKFNGETLPTERDILRGEGLISGGREFCCTIGFDAAGLSKESIFSEPKNSGYNKFYNYYSGALVVVRCRWENGVCRIVDYGSGESRLMTGLNGIRTNNAKYDTLFDFYRDTKQVEKLDKACTYNILGRYGISATSPVYMADGRVGYVAIYPRYDAQTGKDGIKTTVYDNGYFDESYNATYSSPVDYKSDAQEENFHEKFSLVFDDYNGDGSADFALKQSAEDENSDGATYEVRCMSNDLTPRSDRFSFYMAGRHEESIRLQHADSNRFVYWQKGTDGKLTSNVTVDDYRMYSERYYLPPELRIYDDEKTVYCFFWNNTAKDVKVGGKYHIEYNKNGNWVSVTSDKTLAAKTAKAYRDTELGFDISDVKRTAGEYRIAMKVSGKAVYGGFYIGSRNAKLSVNADEKTIPAGTGFIDITVKNTGTEPVRITSAYVASGSKKISDISVSDSLILAGGEKQLTAELDRNLAAGKYTIKIPYGTKTASYSFTVKKVNNDALTYFGGKCTAKISDGKLSITVKNNKFTKEKIGVMFKSSDSPEVFMNGKWVKSGWLLTTDGKYNADGIVFDIAYGKTGMMTFSDYYSEYYKMVMEDPEMKEQAKQMYDYFKESLSSYSGDDPEYLKEYEKYKDITFEEFVKLLITGGNQTDEAAKNSLYRLKLNGEYVYFVV